MMFPTIRRIAALIGILCASMIGCTPAPEDLRVRIEKEDGGTYVAVFTPPHSVRELRFNAIAQDYRKNHWSIKSPGFHIAQREKFDIIARKDGTPFREIIVSLTPDNVRLEKDYQPFSNYGEGGVLIYTGHFWPVDENGERIATRFDFIAPTNNSVIAFGQQARRLDDWQSPHNNPAFVYLGPLQPVDGANAVSLIDPKAPDWTKEDFNDISALAMNRLANVFATIPKAKPNLFLAAMLGDDPGRLSFSGDALPGQYQITLRGGAWRKGEDSAREIFRRSLIHEAVHLWQWDGLRSEAGPGADWIHEGGADAISAEVMLALRYWDAAQYEAFRDKAEADCAASLKMGSLATAYKRSDFHAYYSCGFIIADAIAVAEGSTTGAFWRDFTANARQRGYYAEDDFYAFVAGRPGGERLARAIKYFVTTPLADTSAEIERLRSIARAAVSAAPLAPGKAR